MRFRPWREAWHESLYGPAGFYRRPEGPAGHFRTATHAAPDLLAAALATLAAAAGCTRVVDVGAGRGELLTALRSACPDLELVGVDVVERPVSLPADIGWRTVVPDLPGTGSSGPLGPLVDCLLVGWELLDVVPCVVAEVDGTGTLREVEVSEDGSERLAEPVVGADLEWCERWWPGPPGGAQRVGGQRLEAQRVAGQRVEGQRVEVGATRDDVWAALAGSLTTGLAVAVDYDHTRSTRPPGGSLTGFRGGRQVPPVADGSCDVTAHVALDAVAAASSGDVVRQRDALRQLGVRADRPPPAIAAGDPVGYVRALSGAGQAAELLDPGGLGGFGWLGCPRGALAEAAWSRLVGTAPS